MGKLFYVIGKSATGKDTIFQKLLENESLALKPLVLYTTRPMRAGEEQGVQYHFTNEAGLTKLQNAGKVIELRAYDTVHGVWKYFTADTEATDLEKYNYAGVGVLESYRALRNYYGAERVIPIYIEVEDGERLQRALDRERGQQEPKYAELCRPFYNRDLKESIEKISAYIKEHK